MKSILKSLLMSVLFLGCWITANAAVNVSFSDTTKTPLTTFKSSMTACENAVNTKVSITQFNSSSTATENAINTKIASSVALSSFTGIEVSINSKLTRSSGTEIERLYGLTLASFTINDGNVASKIASSVVLSSFTGIEASINTKTAYSVFYGSMTSIETQKNTIAGDKFVITTASSPATVDSPTAIGNIRWGQDVSDGKWYLYISTATNSWSRTQLTW